MFTPPTPHLEKLRALLANPGLPEADKPRVQAAIDINYADWIGKLAQVEPVQEPEECGPVVKSMVALLNEYKNFIDADLIFDSPHDFLYRQKGQTKLDNSIIEEFLPHLMLKCVLGPLSDGLTIEVGPKKAFSAIYFTSTLDVPQRGGGLHVRTKDQDFAIARKVFIKSSYSADFEQSEASEFYVAYVAAECKTNLDKTMFQEACATAHDVKSAVPGSKYYLLCEWLDMTPEATAATDIDEVLILRKAKRIGSNQRSHFRTVEGRKEKRQMYLDTLKENPFSADVFLRLVEHVLSLVTPVDLVEDDVLADGYF